MGNHKCDICFTEFNNKYSLEKHLARKNKCDIITDFQCKKCLKYFKYKKNLLEHTEKNNCNSKIIPYETKNFDDEYDEGFIDSPKREEREERSDEHWLKSIINSSMSNDIKVGLLSEYNKVLGIDKITAVIQSDMPLIDKIFTIHKIGNKNIEMNTETNSKTNTKITNNINNGSITTNNTNTTNNIQINNFGNEKLEYLDNEYFKDLIMNNHIQTANMKLIEDTYLHKDHPENKTIKIENLNSKYGFVFESGKWRPIVKYELKELMHEKNNKLLKIHYRRLKEFLTAAKKSSIQVFFSRIYDHDPHLKLMNDQMVLLFYEGKPKTTI
jgi:hypothetical protein